MLDNLHFVKELGLEIGAALEKGHIDEFGRLMNVHWQHKKKRSKSMSTGRIDEWYELALKNGALGGKLIGAGGGLSNHRSPYGLSAGVVPSRFTRRILP